MTPPARDTNSAAPTNKLGASYYKLLTGTVVSNLGDGIGTIAYPWLASAVTRDPILISLVMVAQRLPWLLFTLPAGVITDRTDRRKTIITMDVTRGVITLAVAFAVLGKQGALPSPDEVSTVADTSWLLYLTVLGATLLLGFAEVLRDNANQTIMPNIVRQDQLERANGRLWSLEQISNGVLGPPLGTVLLLVAFSVPFFVDAATFFAAAALMFTIPGSFRAERAPNDCRAATDERSSFFGELREGVSWLMGHSLLRPMAIVLGLMNGAMTVGLATFVLFAQEVLDVGPVVFTIMGFGGAIGGFLGGQFAPAVFTRLGQGPTLALTVGGSAVAMAIIGTATWWPIAMTFTGLTWFLGMTWNVITVSLRQAIIPAHLLGRVNSVYRFFAWGMMPIGAALGGGIVWLVTELADRDLGLRATWWVGALIHAGLFSYARPRLTTAHIEQARAEAGGNDKTSPAGHASDE